jgi:NadR type nicotinamide-nucleotide adenylyltransferase
MIRIAVTGPESSGKTTLTKLLAAHYQCPWVNEYAREYLRNRQGHYSEKDLLIMSRQQRKIWDSHAHENLLFYDTEMLVFQVWSEVKYNSCHPEIREHVANQKIDLYLLCRPDIPWEEDPLRENPFDREVLFDRYINHLNQLNKTCVIIEGSLEKRLEKAHQAIYALQTQ